METMETMLLYKSITAAPKAVAEPAGEATGGAGDSSVHAVAPHSRLRLPKLTVALHTYAAEHRCVRLHTTKPCLYADTGVAVRTLGGQLQGLCLFQLFWICRACVSKHFISRHHFAQPLLPTCRYQ